MIFNLFTFTFIRDSVNDNGSQFLFIIISFYPYCTVESIFLIITVNIFTLYLILVLFDFLILLVNVFVCPLSVCFFYFQFFFIFGLALCLISKIC